MTKSHEDRINVGNQDYGYSIRVGQYVPPNAVNLAYVHTSDIDPKKNLLVTDMSGQIVENKLASSNASTLVYPDENLLLRELNKPFYSLSKNVLVTNEFSVPTTGQETPEPLYYLCEAKNLFDCTGATVTPYLNGYVNQPITNATDYSQVNALDLEVLLYLGGKIRITMLDGSPVPSTCKYKVKLIKQTGDGIPPKAYRILVYTNFRGDDKQSFVVRYEKYNSDGSHTTDYTEVLNSYPFFTETSLEDLQGHPDLDKFALVETEDRKWQVYAPSKVMIADNTTRPAQQFQYKIKGRLNAKMNAANPGEINIGIVYLNTSVFNAEDLVGVVKKAVENSYKPQYLSFLNPHPPDRAAKESPNYWVVDLTMPSDYLNDYDLIILTGYGIADLSMYNDAIRTYLQNGGRLWIDNGGSVSEGTQALQLTNFLTNIGFSTTEEPQGTKQYAISDDNLSSYEETSLERRAIERLYNIDKNNMLIGYPNVNPIITFGFGEDSQLWSKIVMYQSGNPSIMTRKIYEEGTLIVSNCGIFRSMANRNADDIKLIMNMILAVAEEKTVYTPWIKDYVYNRDNLFKEEYVNGDHAIYIDDRSDLDKTQIVAKKILNKSVRDALIPYMPSAYYKAKGTFKVQVQADTVIPTTNGDFEVGTYNSGTNSAVILWTATTPSAIPGWSTKYVSGITSTFEHISSISQRGKKAVELSIPVGAAGGQSYWYTTLPLLPIGTYRASAWLKTVDVQGHGAEISLHTNTGTLIQSSAVMLGKRDWTKVEVEFSITTASSPELRIGYVLGDSSGAVFADSIEVVGIGSVYMTPDGNGETALYAYSVRPYGDVFDLQSQGFSVGDVSVYDPPVSFYCLVRSFVYKWDNDLVAYVREYGNQSRTLVQLRRSDGVVNVGLVSTLVPNLQAGAEWADKTKIFFEVSAEAATPSKENDFVNVSFFNTQKGHYYYSESGEDVIGYSEIYNDITIDHIIIQAWTDYYTIRATSRRYSVGTQGDDRIYLQYPATVDERDSWFLRVHNGSFVKNSLNYNEYEEFRDFYNGRVMGVQKYTLPEYERQLFKPGLPFRRVRKEVCEYINESTIRVQHAPIYMMTGTVAGELMSPVDSISGNKVFKAIHGNWRKTPEPKLWMDNGGNAIFDEYIGEYDIDYVNGLIYLEDAATGALKIDYSYNNIEIFKRVYGNGKIKRERMKTTDKKTFFSSNKNWLLYPNPVVYRLPEGQENEANFIAPVDTYMIDYDAGEVVFYEDINERIYVDYMYSVDKEITIKDVDVQSGIINLGSNISFKDEIYCNYYYEENFVEYRGFYDQDAGTFIHLDLNPSEGHYCTIPTVYTDFGTGLKLVRFENVPTGKLMNKEVYVYLLPYSSTLSETPNNYTIRHCYSKAEWDKIRTAMPGIALLLGVVQLREHTQVKNTTVLDTRVRGGGIKESISRSAMIKKDPLVTSFWDIGPWDGQAYYSNGVIVIRLPKSILTSNGGSFTENDVETILKKYIAYGTYPIIEYV